MKIAIGFDHCGCQYRQALIDYLEKEKMEYVDFGTKSMTEIVQYPEYAEKVSLAVASGECDKGILICGTGIGMSIAANKVKGIRCAVANEYYCAKLTKEHNDSNVLAFGARVIGVGVMLEIVDVWLKTAYLGQPHQARVDMITEMENKYFK